MNVLIVGLNTKMASVFKYFSNVTLLNLGNNYRKYKEMSDYNIINVNLNKRPKLFYLITLYIKLRQIVTTNNIELIFTNRKDHMVNSSLIKIFCKKKNIILLTTSRDSYAWQKRRRFKNNGLAYSDQK